MPATEQAARLTDAHRTLLLRLRQAVVQRAVQSWQTVNFENLDGTFQVFSAATVALLTAAQRRGITSTDAYLAAFMASELGPNATAPPEATVPAGVDQAGRPLTRAILPALIAVKVATSQARPEPEALRLGRNRMVRTVASEVMAAPRAAQAEVMVLDDRIKGWRRVPGPGACGACLAAASGGIDSVEKPMRTHWHCVPGDTLVAGVTPDLATKRAYDGVLIVIRTASNQLLRVTPNHPILTDCGWVPAGVIEEGDHVIRSLTPERPPAAIDPHEYDVPASIEKVWRALRVRGLVRVPSATEDFHGDGRDGQVDVVPTDGEFGNRLLARFHQPVAHHPLGSRPVVASAQLARHRDFLGVLVGDGFAASGGMGWCRECASFIGGHSGEAEEVRLAGATDLYTGLSQAKFDDAALDAVALREREHRVSGLVGGDDLVDGKVQPMRPRFDPTSEYGTPEGRVAHARLGGRLAERLAGYVQPDRVVELRRVSWSGHVFNLQTPEGWYNANGVVVANCRCAQEPVVRSVRERVIRPTGREMFDALSPVEQARMFEGRGGEEKAHLIRSGAVPFEALAQPMPLVEMPDGITETPLAALQTLAA